MKSETKMLRLKNGVRLNYAEQGAGEPVIVLLHGYTDSLRSFDLMRPHLAHSQRVIAVSLRGHGFSDRPADYRIEDFAADLPAFLDALGVKRAIFVGHSMGAGVALQIGAAFPSRVAGLVLIGAFANFCDNPAVLELAAAVDELTDPADPAFARGFQESTLANATPEGFLEMAVGESLRLPALVWRRALEGMLTFDPLAAARACQAPALIVWGDRDAFVPREDQLRLKRALTSARFRRMDSTGHAVHWEKPVACADCIRAFVGEVADADGLLTLA